MIQEPCDRSNSLSGADRMPDQMHVSKSRVSVPVAPRCPASWRACCRHPYRTTFHRRYPPQALPAYLTPTNATKSQSKLDVHHTKVSFDRWAEIPQQRHSWTEPVPCSKSGMSRPYSARTKLHFNGTPNRHASALQISWLEGCHIIFSAHHGPQHLKCNLQVSQCASLCPSVPGKTLTYGSQDAWTLCAC